ncbi:phage tail protein [Jeotgalibacillus aurantiacus]|uniref:phage tail protein n=1 Tax=Jeotgalibacillus aurantiacus TaxID=2763266 RepID=UPI001D0B5E0C|nr:tail fiber protein [Jeotgalibacillus aurantiacus]
MAEAYVGEIRMFAGDYAPQGWAICNGQALPISDNETLYSLIGVTYGGDARTFFNLPDLRGRVPIHRNNVYSPGMNGGAESVTLTGSQLPSHTHLAQANKTQTNASLSNPENNVWGYTSFANYQKDNITQQAGMRTDTISNYGGSQPHSNIMPSFTVNFIIALNGLYPTDY